MGLYKKKKMYVSLFHSVSLCFLTSIFQFFGLFHPVSEIFHYILFVSFVTKQKWVYRKKKDECFIVSFHFDLFRNEHILNFLVCFRVFPMYLNCFIYYETETGL